MLTIFFKLVPDNFASPIGLNLKREDLITWDPLNKLNISGPHSFCPPQWIDHFFLHSKCQGNMTAKQVEVVFKDADVPTSKGKQTLSDHYGVVLTIAVHVPSSKENPLKVKI